MAKRTKAAKVQDAEIAIDSAVNKPKTSRRRKRSPPEIASHTWSRTSVFLAIRPRGGGPPHTRVEFKLESLNLSSDSLLMRVLQSAPFPAISRYVYTLRDILQKLERNTAATRILSRSISQTTPHEIKELYQYIEEIIQTENLNKHLKSGHARGLFKFCTYKLSDNSLLKDFKFKSRFSYTRTEMGKGRPLQGPINLRFPDLSSSKFDSLQERNEKSLNFCISIRDEVISLCSRTLNQHEEVLEKITKARAQGFPSTFKQQSRRAILNGGQINYQRHSHLSKDELLQVAAILCKNQSWALKVRIGYFPYAKLETLHKYCVNPTAYSVLEVLLSEYQLPRLIVAACAIAIITSTSINSEVMSTLKLGNIIERGNHIFFIGIKGKSGQLIEGSFSEHFDKSYEDDDKLRIDNPVAIRALRLLIENTRKIENYSGNVDLPLLSTLYKKNRHTSWEPIDLYRAFNEFWEYHNVNRISPRDLRRLGAHILFLSPGETIFSVQVLLGHGNINTTIEYVNTNIIAHLLDANIRRFGEKLAATALFATNRGGELQAHGLSTDDIQPLLFPISKFSTEKCAADEWIDSSGEYTLSLGIAEIRHCSTQYRYYQNNFCALLNENPKKFALVHLPRIFFCCSLRKILLSSPHCSLYQKYEEGEL